MTGGVLGGSGEVNSLDNTSGEVRPGTSPGVLTVDGDFTQGPDGTLTIDVNGTGQGTQFDFVNVTNSFNAMLGGTLAIVQGGFDPQLTDTFQFLRTVDDGMRTGTFSTVTGTALP